MLPHGPIAHRPHYTVRVPPGPGYALFFYIAGARPVRGTEGGDDVLRHIWRSGLVPVLPTAAAGADRSHRAEAVRDMGIICYHLPMDRLLADRIEEAQANNNIVIIIVDPWTLRLPDYRKVLEGCDRRDYYNCAVLLAWNKNDAESSREISELNRKIREEVFRTKFANRASNYFWEPIASRDELVATLIQAVSGARRRSPGSCRLSKRCPIRVRNRSPSASSRSFRCAKGTDGNLLAG